MFNLNLWVLLNWSKIESQLVHQLGKIQCIMFCFFSFTGAALIWMPDSSRNKISPLSFFRNPQTYLESSQTPMVEAFAKKNFPNKIRLLMFDWFLNTPLVFQIIRKQSPNILEVVPFQFF